MGKRIITSVFGIPVTFIGAIFLLFIIQTGYDLFVGDRTVLRMILLVGSSIGLLLMIIFSILKKRTVANMFMNSLGVRG